MITYNIEVENSKIKKNNEKVPDYRRTDFNKFRRSLASYKWNHLLNHNDINTVWRVFTNKLKQMVESCIPLCNRRKIKNSKPKSWNSKIKNSLLAKKRVYQKYKTTKDINDRLEHYRIRHITKRLIKQSKQNVELHIANSCQLNPKEFYSYIRKKKVRYSPHLLVLYRQPTENTPKMNLLWLTY